MLVQPGGRMYGIDVKPWNVKAHLAYSLHRLGLDYVDLYEPARMDESIPVEEVVGAVQECVEAEYVRHIGLTQISAENLKRAAQIYPIHTAEYAYSLSNRCIEQNGVLETAREHGIGVLAFGVLSHGLLSDHVSAASGMQRISNETREQILSGIRKISVDKNTTVEQLLQAYVYCKNPDMRILVGTTRKEHLRDSIDALGVKLSAEDIARIEAVFPANLTQGMNMRNFTFRDGKMEGWRSAKGPAT